MPFLVDTGKTSISGSLLLKSTNYLIQSTGGACQIVNLGAGSDTLYFALKDAQETPELYVEVDLASNIQQKAMTIQRRRLLESTSNSHFLLFLFFKAGWKKAKGWTINQVYKMLPSSTRYRVEHLELLDDLEVTMQLFDHYCILLATNDEIICPDEQLKESLATIE
ncbi:uncharacterized protein DC041_0006170 [Schistosoma bovis]|uniref:[phosphatase 2A protein]-leucine-carboxy methyltransferase n=1 Tax=Schistosoma bovis TaxID=6184 RepID=A0A430QFW9_SCHBO|nr:uncharacterized protein DC041_0006170 [Schistosoma bovis]